MLTLRTSNQRLVGCYNCCVFFIWKTLDVLSVCRPIYVDLPYLCNVSIALKKIKKIVYTSMFRNVDLRRRFTIHIRNTGSVTNEMCVMKTTKKEFRLWTSPLAGWKSHVFPFDSVLVFGQDDLTGRVGSRIPNSTNSAARLDNPPSTHSNQSQNGSKWLYAKRALQSYKIKQSLQDRSLHPDHSWLPNGFVDARVLLFWGDYRYYSDYSVQILAQCHRRRFIRNRGTKVKKSRHATCSFTST